MVNLPTMRFWPWGLIWAVLFALSYTQSPAYYSNQHQYYLHGFAEAGVGYLNEDWLANTQDPTPVYSWFVAQVYRLFGPFAFQVIYFLLLVVYFESIRRIIGALPGFPKRGPAMVLFLTLFLASHAAIVRVASVRLLGVDYPWYLQAGLAAQYLLGPGLQPSAFGVLLVVSLAAFVNQRPILAAILAAAAAVIHATYMLPAGLMVFAYLVVFFRDGKTRVAIISGALALAMVLPVVAFNARTFLAGDCAANARSPANLRARSHSPSHGVPSLVRLDGRASNGRDGASHLFSDSAKPAVFSLWRFRRRVVRGSDRSCKFSPRAIHWRCCFPWRFSAVLMPVAVAILFAKLSMALVGRFESGQGSHLDMRVHCNRIGRGRHRGDVSRSRLLHERR